VSLPRIIVIALGLSSVVSAVDADRLFAREIKPLLAAKCFACHGQNPALLLGELNLTTREGLLRGGKSGRAALAPGDAATSPIYQAVTWADSKLQMPPKENDRLTPQQVDSLRDWINSGAPWPDNATIARYQAEPSAAGKVQVETSGGLADDWTNRSYDPEDLWAFQRVASTKIPDSSADNPIDAFHRAKLEAVGFKPANRADRLTLLRRAAYDLTGLPPSLDEAKPFLEDDSQSAWETLVDRLLASPAYGEQWGRHWLDVARYADTAGNSNDYERSNAWRYRDYVIRSFNDDKPYDRFVMEQLAGDELEPDNPEMLVATGFLRMGQWGSAMLPKKIARQAYLDDVVHSVGQTFLSTPLRCAKCHDHKFDPIPTRDYYRFYAAFAGTQIAERPAAFLERENLARFDSGRQHVEKLKNFASERKNMLDDLEQAAARRWFEEHGRPFVAKPARNKLPDDEKPPRHYGMTQVEEGRQKVRMQDEWIWTRRLERYEAMAQSVFNGPDYIPGNGRKLRVPEKIDPEWKPQSAIFDGGSVHAPSEAVTPGVLSAIHLPTTREPSSDPYELSTAIDGRRMQLARWITDPRNPLTTRSIVNRVWSYHFGRGLAANPNNFGKTGSKPTHPELLDWLTADFVANGWSIKRLHRLIMTSQLYQQSGEHPAIETLREQDPDNHLLAYYEPRRLTAEEIRDSMLAISGELNPELGGVPAMPEINMEVALQPRMIQFSIAPAYQPSATPAERNRRSIYSYRVRGQADPFLEVFNQPNPNDSCERRDAASVSPQALTMMNSDAATDRSIAFALRLEGEASSVSEQISRAFHLAYLRDPTAGERRSMADYLADMQAHHRDHTPKPSAYPTRVTRSLVEEFSGKPFEYEEWLPVFENYQPDVKAWQVEPETRALADLCLLLFNSNEFVYVY
jgi:hypothetical protein